MPTGTYYLILVADDLHQVNETNEDNNAHTADSGPIRLSWSSTPPTISVGQTVNGAFTPEASLPYSGNNPCSAYQFTIGSAQKLNITLNSTAIHPYLIVRNSSGTIVATDFYGGGNHNSLTTQTFVAGTYYIEAGIVGSVATGTYVLSVTSVPSVPCSYSISTSDLGTQASGSTIGLTIHTDAWCSWSITNLPAWLTVSGSLQGTGSAIVTLVAAANTAGPRTALVAVGGASVPVRQLDTSACGGSSSCSIQVLPHVAFGGEWTTGLSAISAGTQTGSFAVGFYGDAGTSVSLPFTGGLGNQNTLSGNVPAQGMTYYEAEDPSAQVQGGWGLVTADGSVTVQANFRRRTADGNFYEAAVPASEGYSGFVMPFDATTFAPTGAQMFTGFAIVNLNPSESAHVVCTARDQSGTVIPNAVSIPMLPPLGHYANYLFPALAGQRGTLDCTADTLLSAIGLRFIGTNAFSTLPVIVK